jgi:DNA-binding NtrC family response regulator
MTNGVLRASSHSRGRLVRGDDGQVLGTILIIDDEIDVLDSCERILKKAGFSCLTATNVPIALSLFNSQQLMLVLSDIDLVNGNGFEIAQYVRDHAPAIPVILMTGGSASDAVKRAASVGVAGYLRKPFSNSELIVTVRSQLGGVNNVGSTD